MGPLVESTAIELTGGKELVSFLGVLNTAAVEGGPSTAEAVSALEAFELLVDLMDEADEPPPAGTYHHQ